MKRYGKGMGGIKDMFGSVSSSMSGNNQGLKYYCMGCGKEHREIACPNCGSKMKSVGYDRSREPNQQYVINKILSVIIIYWVFIIKKWLLLYHNRTS